MAHIEIERLPQFDVLYNLPPATRTVILIGGRGGAKTYEASKWIAYQSTARKKRVVVLRDEKSLIKESILNEVLLRYDTADADGVLSRYYQKSETGIKRRMTGEMVVFTKGFRASRKDTKANMKSVSNIDIAVIEEAEDIRDRDKFNTFADSIRKDGSLIMIILNTPDLDHWIVRQFFNAQLAKDDAGNDLDGYYQIIPKKLAGVVTIQTNYTDNPYLPKATLDSYQAYGDPQSATYNPHYFLTAIKGLASSGRKGQIHKKVRPIKLDEYMQLPYPELFGQDFGTARPAGMVGVKVYKNTSWARQLNYLPMSTLSIAKHYIGLGMKPGDRIVADNADKEALDKLKAGYSEKELSDDDFLRYPGLLKGFHMIASKKGPGSIRAGLSLMDSLQLFAVEESLDLWKEIQNRVYYQNKMLEYTNDPAPGFDHLMDPWMYVLVDIFGHERGKKGKLSNSAGYFG